MRRPVFSLLLAMAFAPAFGAAAQPAVQQAGCQTFPETGIAACGKFLAYWQAHGGLTQQGYPISGELHEVSDEDGNAYAVQYFERAVFEYHPEHAGTPYEVLLSLLGNYRYQQSYGQNGASNQHASPGNTRFFKETGHTLGGKFREYWESHGGLSQQGYPISDEFQERNDLDGKTYLVQYFERAVFEYHPENVGTPYEVLLSQLGTYFYKARYTAHDIPAPSQPEREQREPTASDSYVVWTERGKLVYKGLGNSNIMALNLRNNQRVTVVDAPGDQYAPAISDSTVVWLDFRGPYCDMCSEAPDILGQDLATGQTFTVTTTGWNVKPAIADKTVAWVSVGYTTTHLMTKNLDSGETAEIASVSYPNKTTFGSYALSREYLVWAEGSNLRTYNFKRGQIRTLNEGGPIPSNLAVSGHYAVWTSDKLQMTDLNSGTTTTLYDGPAKLPSIKDNTVLWSTFSPTREDLDVWGLKLTNKKPGPLVTGPGNQVRAVIGAGSLVWYNEGGPGDKHISSALLTPAFANSTVPPPVPTAKSILIHSFPAGWLPNVAASGRQLYYYEGDKVAGSIYAYDVDKKETRYIRNQRSTISGLTSDGQWLAWIEGPSEVAQIKAYNMESNEELSVTGPPANRRFTNLALDQGMLYYQDQAGNRNQEDQGLYVYDLVARSRYLINPNGQEPVAADGHVLWREPLTDAVRLHLGTKFSTYIDEVIHSSPYNEHKGVRSYSLSGDKAVWSTWETDDGVTVYDIPSRSRQTLPLRTLYPRIGGNTIAWWEQGQEFLRESLKAYNLKTGVTTVLLADQRNSPFPQAIFSDRVVAYITVEGSSTSFNLYLIDLPPDR